MPFIPNFQNNVGLYIATTDVWEISRLQDIDVNSEEFKLLLVRLYQNVNNIAIALNLKDSALYPLTQFVNGQQFFSTDPNNPNNTRSAFRIVIDVGPLGAGVTTVPHGLPIQTSLVDLSTWTFTRIYGAATRPDLNQALGDYYPLPFASAGGANNIELKANNTNVVITNNSGVNFDRCYVVLEWVKN